MKFITTVLTIRKYEFWFVNFFYSYKCKFYLCLPVEFNIKLTFKVMYEIENIYHAVITTAEFSKFLNDLSYKFMDFSL